ncbi:ferric reductase-like transmembrane domain-containing protein [Gloeobacter kilaueensis]|nr:ferric reductase-like transmembrane domain-containing protein [Gloeobacter kilaueensis]
MSRGNANWMTTLAVLVAAYIAAALLETVSLIFYNGHPQGQHLAEYYGWASLACLGAVLLAPVAGWPALRSWRRGLGLSACGFALAHTALIYLHVLGNNWEGIDFLNTSEQAAAWLGVAALALMLPLALTSANWWVRQLGRNWRRLHLLVWPIALLSLGHALWLGASAWLIKLVAAFGMALILWVRRYRRRAFKESADV